MEGIKSLNYDLRNDIGEKEKQINRNLDEIQYLKQENDKLKE